MYHKHYNESVKLSKIICDIYIFESNCGQIISTEVI